MPENTDNERRVNCLEHELHLNICWRTLLPPEAAVLKPFLQAGLEQSGHLMPSHLFSP
jgi:hypothetical protein